MSDPPDDRDATKDADDFYESLKTDRFIKLYIANEEDPAFVSERHLMRSSEWFATALDPKWNREEGVLRFPDDYLDSWKTLLFWMAHGVLPRSIDWMKENDGAVIHLIRCWYLGDKYLMPAFQDATMQKILECLIKEPYQPLGVIAEGLEKSGPDSKMRLVLMDCLVAMWQRTEVSDEELDEFDNVVAFASTFALGVKRYALSSGPTFKDLYCKPTYYILSPLAEAETNSTVPLGPKKKGIKKR